MNDPHENATWVYNYDRGGNITSKVQYAYVTTSTLGTPVDTISYTYSDANWKDKLKGYDGQSITYDAIGNPANDGMWTYKWQAGRQLKKMVREDRTLDFKYDHNGMRVQKVFEHSWYPETTKYTYHGKLLTHMTVNYTDWDEIAQQNKLHFFYDADGHVAKVSYNGIIYTYVHNLQGDVVGLLDNSGNLVVEYKYDAWGKPLSTTGTLADTLGKRNPFRYREYIYDEESELYYLQSRYYRPEIMRFVSSDRENILEDVDGLLSFNFFAYCLNNPVSWIDYDGEAAANIIGGIFGGLTGAALGTLVAKLLGLRGFAKVALIAVFAAGGVAAGALLGPSVAKYAKRIIGSIKAAASSMLRIVSRAATKAARAAGRFTVSAKHLADAGGRYAKFSTNNQDIIRSLIRKALQSPNAQFYANGKNADSFIVLYKFANAIGTKGEKYIKIVITIAGKIITAYPRK